MYDQFGAEGPQGGFGGFGGANGFGGFGNGGYYSYSSSNGFDGFSDFGDLGDIFSSFFGGGARTSSSRAQSKGPRKGADLNLNMDITFEEAFLGVEKKYLLQDQKHVQCVMEQVRSQEQQYQNVLYVMELEL